MWDNIDGCAEHYRCSTELYLFSILSQAYNKCIDHCVIIPGHWIEVVGGLNATNKMCLFQVNEHCAASLLQRVLQTYGNTLCNP